MKFRKLKKYVATVPAVGLLAFGGSVFAAVPESVTTALGDAKTDAITVASLSLVVIVAIAAFKYMRRGV